MKYSPKTITAFEFRLTKVMSLEAAAALMWRLGCRTELLQSNARANVPTELQDKDNQLHVRHYGKEEHLKSDLIPKPRSTVHR